MANALDIPPGTYRSSCGGCKIEAEMLVCDQCEDSRGALRRSFIALTECESFTNRDGFLVCEKV